MPHGMGQIPVCRLADSVHAACLNVQPKKTTSVLRRPIKTEQPRKNCENVDVQFARDKEAFERRASSYRRLASEPAHHNHPQGSILTLWEKGNIVDRGRGRPQGVLTDPIIQSSVAPPPEGANPARARPQR